MPSKRTNDSVDRILQELSVQQTRDVVRDSVNDRKVDEQALKKFLEEHFC